MMHWFLDVLHRIFFVFRFFFGAPAHENDGTIFEEGAQLKKRDRAMYEEGPQLKKRIVPFM